MRHRIAVTYRYPYKTRPLQPLIDARSNKDGSVMTEIERAARQAAIGRVFAFCIVGGIIILLMFKGLMHHEADPWAWLNKPF